ncbi:MAG: family 78 glycoside hydrolase catalytic domain [Clostridia bacterium]|nr:family 78 glycoside hydrolase catalytic domain [Clostridia bacterium]
MRLDIQCNGKLNPKGVDFSDLRFSLETEGIENIKSVEYEFYIDEQVETGKVFHKEKGADRFCSLGFEGFHCGDRLFYRAIVTTAEKKYCSELYYAECGLRENDVVGQWIENKHFDGRVSEFFKQFVIEEEIIAARLYIVGLGFYSSKINGVQTDEYYFKPLLTDFDERHGLKNNPWYDEENFSDGKKTVCYDTYDVTALLKKGKNNLSVLLGTGWYCNTDKDFVDPSFTFGIPKLFFELHVQGECSKTIIKSDESCRVRNTYVKSQLFEGDFVDFTKDNEAFEPARLCSPPTGKLVPALAEKDVVLETIEPLEIKKERGKILYDFGKNHTGGLRLFVKGKCGDKLSIKYYEVLAKDGTPNPDTCRWTAYLDGKEPISHLDQQGNYILSGEVDEICPLFHWNCYRYAELEVPDDCEILSLSSLFISTNIVQDGEFRCSLKIFNELYRAFVLTQRDNMHCGVPSDCPHREKLPYTGDGQLVAESAMYVFGAETFYRKWLKDIIAAQGKNGWVPYTAPFISGGGGYWWCNALTTIPLILYKFTGDKSVLKEALQPSLKLVNYYDQMHDGDYVIKKTCTKWLLGDWLAPDVIASNIAYINTLAFYSAISQVKEMADFLFERELSVKMENLLAQVKEAINENFFDKDKLQYGNGVQGEDVLPIVHGIVPEKYSQPLWQKVVAHYKRTGCFDTGIVLTPVLLDALTVKGETDLAVKLMSREEYPSFASMLKNETTLCEHWSKYWPKTFSTDSEEEALSGDVSHCHPMYGSVVAWMYKYVAGLDLSEMYNGKILFAPRFTNYVREATAQKNTAFGVAAIKYEAYGSLKMQIRVPHGIEGEVRLPNDVCERFYAQSEGGKQLKSRKRENYIYAKLSGGEWIISSDVSFGK